MTAEYWVIPWRDTARFDRHTPPGAYRISDHYSHFRIWMRKTAHGWSQRHQWKTPQGSLMTEDWIPGSASLPKDAYRCNRNGDPYGQRKPKK